MKITKVEIQNLKAIDRMSVDLEGKHVLITAENGFGKSSFLQAILLGLGMKSSAPPVREGEKEGEVTLITDAGYTFHSEVDKIKGVTKVSVQLPGESLFDSRVSAVSAVVGDKNAILFDPFDFAALSQSEAGKKKQVEEVKALLTEEELTSLTKMERQIKANEEARLETGRELKRMKGAVEAKTISQADIQGYREYISVSELNEQKNAITTANTKITDVQSRFDDRAKRIEALTAELAELKTQQEKAQEFLANNKPQSTVDIDARIQSASHHNTMVDKVKEYQKEFTAFQKLEEQYGEAGSLINSQREAYKDAIRSLELPIPDLTFDEEQLVYKGRAVDPNVMSTSEIMSLGVMMQIAKNPGVRVLVIPRGESLGTQKLNELIEMADMYSYQLLVENVVRGQEELKIEFLTKR